MGVLDLLSNFRDLFEIGRKTSSDKKSNKQKVRNYDFEDGEKIPVSKVEYKKYSKPQENSENKTNTERDDESR